MHTLMKRAAAFVVAGFAGVALTGTAAQAGFMDGWRAEMSGTVTDESGPVNDADTTQDRADADYWIVYLHEWSDGTGPFTPMGKDAMADPETRQDVQENVMDAFERNGFDTTDITFKEFWHDLKRAGI
jgi:hypothetical protein